MRARRVRRLVGPVLGTVLFLGVLLGGVFPTRTWLAQRSATEGAEEQLAVLREQNAALEERVRLLHSDTEIERLAREQYNLVRPGEEAYAVLPPRVDPDAPAPPGPAEPEAEDDRNLLEKAWDGIAGIF
jgi:cell division protein FtsB